MFSLAQAPAFYTIPGVFVPREPERIEEILRFLSSRYRGKVHAYQTWNEPNLAREWGVGRLWPNGPRELVELQKHAFVGVRGGDPNAVVVFPPLAPTGAGACEECDHRWGIDDVVYLDAVYRVNGGEVRRYYDALGVHPFGHNNPPTDWIDVQTVPGRNFKEHPSFYFKRFTQLRQVMLDHGDDKPIWFTELGWSSCTRLVVGYEYCLDNSEADQARYLTEAFLLLREAYPYVTHAFVWNLNFPQVVSETDEKWGFGVLRPDGSPRPAYTALAQMPK
jgi:polysaccharide biosynthesis protein PslG